MIVTLDQGRARADARHQSCIKRPYLRGDRGIVAVDQQRLAQHRVRRMTCQMYFHDQAGRHAVDIGCRVIAKVACADMDIVHIEQQAASAAPCQFCHEIDFIPGMAVDTQVVRRVFNGDASLQHVLRAANIIGQPLQRLIGAGKRQQVGIGSAAPGRPGHVLRDHYRGNPLGQRGQPAQMCRVRRAGCRQRQPDAMQRDRMTTAYRLQPA